MSMARRILALMVLGLLGPGVAAAATLSIAVTVRQVGAPGVKVTAPDHQSGNPYQVLTYVFTVQNLGPKPDRFILSAQSSEHFPIRFPEGRDTDLLGPGQVGAVKIQLLIAGNAAAGVQDRLTATATSDKDHTISDQTSVITIVNQVARVVVSRPAGQRGGRGHTLTYLLTIRNRGNGTDRFRLTASSSRGWVVLLPDGALTVPLTGGSGPGSRTTMRIMVTIPPSETLGVQDILTLTVTSEFNPEVSGRASVTSRVRGRR